VHIATEGPLGWSARRVSEELEIPVVSSFHTNFHSYGRHYGFGLLKGCVLAWLRAFHNATLRTFVPSDDLLDDLSASGFRRLRIFSRGVDTRLFNPGNRDKAMRERWGLKADEPAALYVGRLASEKNLDLVRQAYLEMRNRLPDLKMVFVGDGPARAALEQQLPEATFTGMLQGDDLSRAYASADVFLFPSLTETFGNVVTEAMASGLPVLAFAYAAPRRFIQDGVNGFLAPFGDSAAYLAKARLLAGQRHDWARMCTAARATLLPHAWDAIIDAYLKELNSIPHVPAP
jgi:glycosyltransferase involved in cell wall biosynthesis